MEYILFDKAYEVYANIGNYATTGNVAIELISKDGEPFAMLTVNIYSLENGFACIDINNCSGAIDLIKKYKLGKFTGDYAYSGYCKYPIYKLNMENINKYKYKGVLQ